MMLQWRSRERERERGEGVCGGRRSIANRLREFLETFIGESSKRIRMNSKKMLGGHIRNYSNNYMPRAAFC